MQPYQKIMFCSMHISIGGFKTSANYLSDGLNSNKDQEFFWHHHLDKQLFVEVNHQKTFTFQKRYIYICFTFQKKNRLFKSHLFQRKSKHHLGLSKNRETPQKGWWFIMEIPIKHGMIWGDFNPLFSETPIFFLIKNLRGTELLQPSNCLDFAND